MRLKGSLDITNDLTVSGVGSFSEGLTVSGTPVPLQGGGGGAGVWSVAGQQELASNGDTITVSSITAFDYYRVFMDVIQKESGGPQDVIRMRFNNDSGNNYDSDVDGSGNTNATSARISNSNLFSSGTGEFFKKIIFFINNAASSKKHYGGQSYVQDTTDGSTVDKVENITGKWQNTSDQISRIDVIADGTGATDEFVAGSRVVVLGMNFPT